MNQRKPAQYFERLAATARTLRRGGTLDQVQQRMKADGIDITRRTLDRYVYDLRAIGMHIEKREDGGWDVEPTDYTRSLLKPLT